MKLKNEKMYKKILSLLNLNAGSKVLDIEYGNGCMLKNFLRIFTVFLYQKKREKKLTEKISVQTKKSD